MRFGFRFLIALICLMLLGCATHQKAPGATFDSISQELKAAAGKTPKSLDDAVGQAMMPPVQLDLPASAQSVEPRFDLAVSNAPASQVFMALVTGTRYSMLIAPEVSGSVTVNLKSVTVREALETLRELYGYEFKFQGTRIYIQPNTMQTRIFQINYLAGKRQGQSDVRVTSSSISSQRPQIPGTTQPTTGTAYSPLGVPGAPTSGPPSSQISTTQNSDFWNDLAVALTTIVGTQEGRSVIVSPGSGVVLIKAYPSDLRAVENYLRVTQLIVERQVMLEAKIIEVSLSETFQAGVNWSHFGGGSNRYSYGAIQPGTTLGTSGTVSNADATTTVGSIASAVTGKSGFIGLAFQGANFSSLLNFLETQGNVQVLSSPRISTINNQKAVLKVGTDEFFVTNVTSTVSAVGTTSVSTPSITLQPFFSGIALDVTPQIDGDNNIILHVHPSISTVTEKQKEINLGDQGKYTLPLATSAVNETDSIVRVQDGNIVAIGGLMKQSQSSTAGGLPGTTGSSAGLLFGTRSSALTKSELVILIKPTIIRNESSWKDDLIETQSRVQQLDPRLARPQTAQP